MLLHAKYNDILILGYLNFLKMFPKYPTSNFGPQGLEDHRPFGFDDLRLVVLDIEFQVLNLKFRILNFSMILLGFQTNTMANSDLIIQKSKMLQTKCTTSCKSPPISSRLYNKSTMSCKSPYP